MYCKHCGKEIDDNSSFCKYCGKTLNDVTTQSEMPFWEKKLLTYLLGFIIVVVVLVIWLYIASEATSGLKWDDVSYSLIMNAFRLTALIIGVVYLFSRVSFKNRIILFNKSDSSDKKLKKYGYLVYTFFIAFVCMLIVDRVIREGHYTVKDIVVYFILFALLWIIPTFVICSKYDKSQSAKKSNS